MEMIEYTYKGLIFTNDIFHNYTKHNIIMNNDVKDMIISGSLSSLLTKLKLRHQRVYEDKVFDRAYLMDCMHR